MFSLDIFNGKSANERSCVFWWEPRDGLQNAGDHLAKVIVHQMLALKDKEILDKENKKNKLLSVGSVLHFAKTGDSVWGTGINGKISESELKFNELDVRAVRGPRTRELLMKRGINVPNIFGDPGLLLPLFFSKDILLDSKTSSKEFIIIPHMNEDFSLYNKYKENLVSPRQGAISFTRKIVDSNFVISSSLHGIIIAEAYGIPAVFIDNKSGESMFKYEDYYYGTGRGDFPVAKGIEDAFKTTPANAIDFDKVVYPLLNSFPYDLWGTK